MLIHHEVKILGLCVLYAFRHALSWAPVPRPAYPSPWQLASPRRRGSLPGPPPGTKHTETHKLETSITTFKMPLKQPF